MLTVLREYFLGEEPTLLTALVPTCFLSMALYTRSPATNFIFDEQEALLANPYVRAAADPAAKIRWLDAFRRDFWGLPPERTIGSYRPLPDMIWRALWKIGAREQSAFPHDYVNVLLHGVNGALVVLLVTRGRATGSPVGSRAMLFVATAVTTEAVSGVVGIADVLGGTGALLALLALGLRCRGCRWRCSGRRCSASTRRRARFASWRWLPLAALLTSRRSPTRSGPCAGRGRWSRRAATGAGFVFYVEMRRRWFPVAIPAELSAERPRARSLVRRAFTAALRWYAQPVLPHDPLNNPLIEATTPRRIAGALRVYARGLGQVVFPRTLSGDYSAPQEPIPDRLVFPESVIGAAAMVLPLWRVRCWGSSAWRRGRRRAARLDAFVRRGPARHRSHAGRGVRDGVDRRLVHSRSRTFPSCCRRCAPSASGTSRRSVRRSCSRIVFAKVLRRLAPPRIPAPPA